MTDDDEFMGTAPGEWELMNSGPEELMSQEQAISHDETDRFTTDTSKTVLALSVLFGVFTGGLYAWALSGFGITPLTLLAFIIGGALSGRHLMDRANGWLATGRGFHIAALVCVFLPFVFYLPQLVVSAQGESLEAAATFAGSLLGMVIWGIVFGFIAALFGVVGYLFNRKGAQ